MAKTATRGVGKSSFVKEYLNDHPKSNPTAVNEAWLTAGMDGTISPSLVNKVRAEMGLTGNLRPGRKAGSGGKSRTSGASRRSASATKPARPAVSGRSSRGRLLADIEADLDRLLFKVMNAGELATVEEQLRATRRALYRHHRDNEA